MSISTISTIASNVNSESCFEYYVQLSPKLISWDFYKDYLDKEPPFKDLGLLVYLRTYARFIPSLQRREKWCECVLRVVEYNLSLDKYTDFDIKVNEAKELFDVLFNLQGFAAGRSYWIAGTEQTKKDPSCNWNCCFATLSTLSTFTELFYWLLIGAGTGFSVEDKYISKLPKLYCNKKLVHAPYNYDKSIEQVILNIDKTKVFLYMKDTISYNYVTLDNYDLTTTDEDFKATNLRRAEEIKAVTIKIGDSKEGWCLALRYYLQLLALPQRIEIHFNYNLIRPKGTRLKTFGGRASGYGNLLELIDTLYEELSLVDGNIDSVTALTMMNIIGKAVVSGGVRRTAEIALGDSNDNAFIEAKYGMYHNPELAKYRTIRDKSNNSIVYYSKPNTEELTKALKRARYNGEPGIYILGNAQKYDTEIAGTNPCGEAGLRHSQSCNLTSTNAYSCVRSDGTFDYERWKYIVKLITRIGCRQTLAKQWHPEWDRVQKEQRLLGVSIMGIVDTVDALGWNEQQLKDFFYLTKCTVREEADNYHDYLGIPRSARVTLIKPDGTLGKLAGVSEGIHRAYAPYFINRIRFASNDPLAFALLDIGIPVCPENGQGNDLYSDKCNTWVFKFGVKSPTKMRYIDEPATAQLERYKLVQKYYVDGGHNCSITISVANDEWDSVTQWLDTNWDDVIAVSFLGKFDPSIGEASAYPNMPKETCTVDDYNKLANTVHNFSENELLALIAKYEQEYDEFNLDNDCATGSCPIR